MQSHEGVIELSPGFVFAGHRIDALAGQGGMGIVYRATHLALDMTVALKLIRPELAPDESFRERFQRESRLAASIEHPHVLPVRDAGEEQGVLYIVMRYVEGTDIRALLNQRGRLEPAIACGLAAQVASALDAAHARGLVHRDVKPANVLVESRPGATHSYLTDFGLVRHTGSSGGLTTPGQWVGTIDYVAPEQIEGKRADRRSDVYALGCMLFEMLTGEPPYRRDTDVATMYAHLRDPLPSASDRAPGLPAEMDAVLHGAIAKDPDARYGTAGEFGRAMMTALEAQSEPATPATQRLVIGVPPPPATPAKASPPPPQGPPPPAFSPEGAGGEPPPPSSRRRFALAGGGLAAALAAALVLVLVLAGGGSVRGPVDTTRAYFQAIADQDAGAVCELATDESLQVESDSCIEEIQDEFDLVGDTDLATFRELTVNATYALVTESGDHATVSVAFTSVSIEEAGATGATGAAQQVQLVKEDDEWLVSDTADL